jgi:hypothetical protein
VDYAKLRERLLADKQVLVWTGAKRTGTAGIDPKKMAGLVVDDDAAEKTGNWGSSTSVAGYVGMHYLHDGNEQKGQLTATYRFAVKEPGLYDVRVAYTPNPNRATNVPVTIQHADGTSRATLNERATPEIDKMFQSVGKFKFGSQADVVISNAGTNGYVVVDAVQLVPTK